MKFAKRIITIMLTVLVAATSFDVMGMKTHASEANIDPERGRAMGNISAGFVDNTEPEQSIYLDDNLKKSRGGNYTLRKGIDVSKWQGDSIDWEKVKQSGVEFVIVRVGYRSAGDGGLYEDEYYKQNIQGALNAGLRVGVYVFSQAITPQEAIEEAEFLLARVYKYNITLPLVIDYEYSSGNTGRLYNANLSVDAATNVVNAFCAKVQNSGYTGMVYANKYMFTNKLNAAAIAANYRIWVAQYYYLNSNTKEYYHDFTAPASNYQGVYDFHQFSSQGRISGINGNVDLNYWHDDGKIYGQDFSAVFDADFYANKYPDVKNAYGYDKAKLLEHFVKYGMYEGRQGCATFDPTSYRLQYADLRNAYGNNTVKYYQHFINYGKKEGRIGVGCTTLQGATTVWNGVDYAAVYDYNFYSGANADIRKAFGMDDRATLAHFVQYGMNEGRQAKGNFSVKSYKNRYADLRNAYGSNLKSYYIHYINYGRREGRQATGCENQLIGATTVYKGIDYSAVYDFQYYVTMNPDVKNAFGLDENKVLEHFVIYGMKEGRQAKGDFIVHKYKARYGDLQAAYGNDLKSYYLHYINYGKREGRTAN